ncbi:MAG: tetratricopeptide repeat protein, partial [Candidatus Marinimicrobia bacterium]|nr:tetratricopeptide repeat protein [Candidatus Neomarinimicrobiota bacterium]
MKSDNIKNLSIDELTKLIKNGNTNPDNYYRRAIAYKDKGMFDSATADIDHAIILNPKNAEYFFLKALIVRSQWIINPSSTFDSDSTKLQFKNFDKAIELNPNVAKYYLYRGIIRDDFLIPGVVVDGRTIDDLVKAVNINPKYRYAWIKLGDCYSTDGDYRWAIKAYTQAIEIEPE